MNVFVAGGGRVGFHLARLLTIEGHDVTIIERSATRAEQADAALDARTVVGDGSSALLLQRLSADSADLFVAAMGSDEANLIGAAAAKGLGATQAVARVEGASLVESSILYETILNIDYILSPNALTALEIARFLDNPGMVASEDFGRGLVQMRQLRVAPTFPGGQRLRNVLPPGRGVLVGVISREGTSFIPHGDSTLEPGDLVTLIGKKGTIAAVQTDIQARAFEVNKVVVMGGGTIGSHLAKLLDKRNRNVKLLEWNLARCEELAAELKHVKVVNRDATSRTDLDQEHIDTVDAFIATTSDDEQNIMASVLAKEVGAKRVISVVHQPDFAPLVTRLGIDHAVTPRACLANRVLKLVHQKDIATLAVLEEGQVEVMEFSVKHDLPITGRPLREVNKRFPDNSLVATVLRNGEVTVPGGDDRIEVGDTVVMVAALDSIEALQKLFRS
jgi:trk system potassium uptake protein TrkA